MGKVWSNMRVFNLLIISWLVVLLFSSGCMFQQKEISQYIQPDSLSGYWYNQPLRIVQTVLREKDAENYDTQSVVNYLKENHANVLVINAGGIVDFFQNPLPAANINPFLDGRDLLREIVETCHESNIKVIARVDFRGVEEHIYHQHPDWFGIDSKGNPTKLSYTTPELFAPCYLSYYRNEHAKEFIAHLFKEYKIDGIWHNSVHVGGMCWCDRCQADYQQKLNKPIPEPDADDNSLNEYFNWKAGVAEDYLASMRKTVKEFGEDKAYAAEVFGMFDVNLPKTSGIDLYSGARYFDFLLSVGFLSNNTTEIEYKDLAYPAGHVRFLKSLAPEKQAVILFGTNGTSHRYIADPPEDLKIWMWQTISSGGSLWNCNFTGTDPASTMDKRNAFLTQMPYQYMDEYQQLLKEQVPYAPVRILYSKATRDFVGHENPADDDFGTAISGMEKALQEAHLPYSFIPDFKLNSTGLTGCELLILPNVACLSDQQVRIIKNYVEAGGNLLATYQTSLFDESGKRRENFALSELFGCSFQGKIFDTRKDAYQYIANRTELLKGFENTSMLMNGGNTLLCCQTKNTAQIMTQLVPKLNNQPPEKAWKDTLEIESPVYVSNVYGKGKVLYFANQPDKLTANMGHPDFRTLLKNAFDYLQPEPIIETNAPESVHVNITKNTIQRCYIVSLINLTSAPERPVRRLLPVSDIKIVVKLPKNEMIKEGLQLAGNEGIIFNKKQKNRIEIDVNKLTEFASVALFYQ